MSDMRSNDPTVFEHLVQAKLPVTAIASGKLSFFLNGRKRTREDPDGISCGKAEKAGS